jgi:hypothetical protein
MFSFHTVQSSLRLVQDEWEDMPDRQPWARVYIVDVPRGSARFKKKLSISPRHHHTLHAVLTFFQTRTSAKTFSTNSLSPVPVSNSITAPAPDLSETRRGRLWSWGSNSRLSRRRVLDETVCVGTCKSKPRPASASLSVSRQTWSLDALPILTFRSTRAEMARHHGATQTCSETSLSHPTHTQRDALAHTPLVSNSMSRSTPLCLLLPGCAFWSVPRIAGLRNLRFVSPGGDVVVCLDAFIRNSRVPDVRPVVPCIS